MTTGGRLARRGALAVLLAAAAGPAAAAGADWGVEQLMHALGAVNSSQAAFVELKHVATAEEMERALVAAAPDADVVLMAAAVSDFRPVLPSREKIARTGEALTVSLEPNADILARLGRARGPGQVLVGFALETTRDVARARAKLSAKGLDLIVLNTVGDGIGGETNRVILVEAREQRELPLLSKRDVAEHILERVIELRVAGLRATGAKT